MSRLALFDCDGTMIDSQAAICVAMEHAFAVTGHPPPPRSVIRPIVGLSLPEAVRSLVPDAPPEQRATLVEAYKSAFRDGRTRGEHDSPLHDGLVPLLQRLSATGWRLGVATGMSDKGLAWLLETHRLKQYFVTLQTADHNPSKPAAAMAERAMAEAGATAARTVVIGDTAFDMLMAANAGVRGIGVAWGYHTSCELRAAGAIAVADNMAELGDLLDQCADG